MQDHEVTRARGGGLERLIQPPNTDGGLDEISTFAAAHPSVVNTPGKIRTHKRFHLQVSALAPEGSLQT
eukprot:scaffold99589_cov37-Prasinocladus_malaysianus.AAC.1